MTRLGTLFLLALVSSLAANRQAAQSPITPAARAVSWKAETELRTVFTDTATVSRFLTEIAFDGDPTAPDVNGVVLDYGFIDLDRDGTLELAVLSRPRLAVALHVVADVAARTRPPDPLSTEYSGFVLHGLSGFDVESLDAVFKDLDRDGSYEIVMPELLGAYEGAARPPVTMPEVYVWKGGDFVRASARHAKFYREEVLPRLESALQTLNDRLARADASEHADLQELQQKYLLEVVEARKRAFAR